MRIDPKKTICIAIDYQEKLLPAIADKEALMDKSLFLLNCLKILEIPVIMTTQYAKGLGPNVPEIRELIGDANGYDKVTFSVMQEPSVQHVLNEGGYESIIFCGTEAHICVLQSVIDACDAKFHTYLVTDCISSRKPEDKCAALMRAEEEGAFLTSAEALVYELMGSCKIPQFKAITELVKGQ